MSSTRDQPPDHSSIHEAREGRAAWERRAIAGVREDTIREGAREGARDERTALAAYLKRRRRLNRKLAAKGSPWAFVVAELDRDLAWLERRARG